MENAQQQEQEQLQNPFQKTFQSISDKLKMQIEQSKKDNPHYGYCECGCFIEDARKQEKCNTCNREQAIKEKEEKERLQVIKDRQENPDQYLQKIGVGKRYLNATIENFKGGDKYISFCRDWLQNRQSILFYGGYGSGKTHLATALCRELIKQEKMPNMRFVNASSLFLTIRSTFKNDSGTTEQSIVERYCDYDYLFIDDLGADKTSEWSRATMYLILDYRDREMLPTIITSNLTPNQLAENIDGRIASRLANGKIIHVDMPDYRLKR